MDKLKCKYVELGVLYSRKFLYGYKCNIDQIWSDIIKIERALELLDNVEDCNLRGNIVDELNKLVLDMDKRYSDLCNNC